VEGKAVWLAGAAAIMPLAAVSHSPAPAEAASAEPFRPPEGPLLLTRTVRRSLSDGKEVRARRSYEVRFVPEAGGYRLDGRLRDVVVEVPPRLEAMAELERKRRDDAMFPMHVDRTGRLLPGGDPAPAPQVRQAIERFSAEVAQAKIGASDKAQAQAFVRQFQGTAGLSPWPQDLFRPLVGARRETRTVALPDGGQGEVSVEITAREAGPGGLLVSLSRRVTNTIEGSMRATEEHWTLAPL
jgi:hypothetical protein